MAKNTVKSLNLMGCVVVAQHEAAAMRLFMRLKFKDTMKADARLFHIPLKNRKKGHFLVSKRGVSCPFDPCSGKSEVELSDSGLLRNAVPRLFGVTDLTTLLRTYLNIETSPFLFIATCPACHLTSLSDTEVLMKHCTCCGEGLPQHDEGEEVMNLDFLFWSHFADDPLPFFERALTQDASRLGTSSHDA